MANKSLDWVAGYTRRDTGVIANTHTANYTITHLMEMGYLNKETGKKFLEESGLLDFAWKMHWPEDFETPDEYLVQRINEIEGFVVFVHGWTGNNTIWEELPGKVVLTNRKLVALSLDHNGFGFSKFADVNPSLDTCNPPAAMRTIERWANMMNIRRQPGDPSARVINFVGHSMGGATLFYHDPAFWHYGEVTYYAIAPALLLEDEMHRAFYTTLGIGISVLQRVEVFKFVEKLVKPTVVRSLTAGSSDYVKETHTFQYDVTPRGITGATFLAMGQLKDTEIAEDWDSFRVMLAHRDRLVGLVAMMDLLCKLDFPVSNIRVVPGTHYMFSISNEDSFESYQHVQNRELVVEDVLMLHEQALEKQRSGSRLG